MEFIMYKETAESYYRAIGNKKEQDFAKFLDDKVEFIGPMASLKGKEAVIHATKNFMNTIQSLSIESSFSNENQAMVVYCVEIPGVSKAFPGASLLNFKEGKIVRIQLFFDTAPVTQKKDEIYS